MNHKLMFPRAGLTKIPRGIRCPFQSSTRAMGTKQEIFMPYRSRIPYDEFQNLSIEEQTPGRIHPTLWDQQSPFTKRARENAGLTQSQLEFYDTNGYLILRNAIPDWKDWADKAKVVRQEQMDLAKQPKGQNDMDSDLLAFTEPTGNAVKAVFGVHKTEFAKEGRSAALVHVAEALVGSPVYIHQSRINYQAANRGTGFFWHSDFEAWWSEDGMQIPRAVSVLVFLEKWAPYNGALMVIPGSHHKYVRCGGEAPKDNWKDSMVNQNKLPFGKPSDEQLAYLTRNSGRSSDQDEIMYLEGNAGDVAFFEANIMHGSQNNISCRDRVGAYFVYSSVENVLGEPHHMPTRRPEHFAVRDPTWMAGIQPL